MAKNQKYKFLLFFIIIFSLALPAQAKRKRKVQQKRPVSESVTAAIKKSEKEQKRIRVKLSFEEDERFQSWNERKQETIRISHTGTSSIQPIDIGNPNFSYDDVGEDHSGLNRLKNSVDEDSTDIDFDAELREVSSNKN